MAVRDHVRALCNAGGQGYEGSPVFLSGRIVMGLLTLALIGVQVGVIGAVSALVAPTVFKALETSAAGAFLRRLFPRYFVTAAILGLLASVSDAQRGVPEIRLIGTQWHTVRGTTF